MHIGSQVYIGFDDFSLAGKHLLKHCHVQDTIALEPQKEDFTSNKWLKYITFRHFKPLSTPLESSSYPKMTFVLIDTKKIQDEEMWEFTSFLMDFLMKNKVKRMTFIGSLHLPFVKEQPQKVASQVILYGPENDTSTNGLLKFDGEIKDKFLTCMIHFIRIEQSIGAQLLLVKGFKPGPFNEGTKEAIEHLSKGLEMLSQNQIHVDIQKAFQTLEDCNNYYPSKEQQQSLLYH